MHFNVQLVNQNQKIITSLTIYTYNEQMFRLFGCIDVQSIVLKKFPYIIENIAVQFSIILQNKYFLCCENIIFSHDVKIFKGNTCAQKNTSCIYVKYCSSISFKVDQFYVISTFKPYRLELTRYLDMGDIQNNACNRNTQRV